MSFDNERDKEIVESEKAILSSILYHFKEIEDLIDLDAILVSHFVTIPARRIFQSLRSTKPVDGQYDPILVLNKLNEHCLNANEIEECTSYIEDLPKNVQYFSIKKYLSLLNESKIKRDLNSLARRILRKNLSDDSFNDSIEQWKYSFNEIVSQSISINYLGAKDAIQDFDHLVELSNNDQKTSFLKTGYLDLDKKIKALNGGQLIIIASRPGVGKTTFSLNLIHNNFGNIEKVSNPESEKQPAIGVFSLEMTTSSLVSKLIAINSGVELSSVQRLLDGGALADFENKLIGISKKRIAGLNLLFCDEANITLGRIMSTIKAWVKEYDMKFIVIDYLQLVNIPEDRRLDHMNQYQKIGMISRNLKILAMELNICIIALAQLNRKAEERKGTEKSPILSDLRESGSIEQDADIVMFLYENKENKDQDEEDAEDQARSLLFSTPTMLKIAKNRHGPVGSMLFIFDKVFGTYKLEN